MKGYWGGGKNQEEFSDKRELKDFGGKIQNRLEKEWYWKHAYV